MNEIFGDKGPQGTPGYTIRGYEPVRFKDRESEAMAVTLTRTEFEQLIRHDERLELITALAAGGRLSESALDLLLSIDDPSVKDEIRYHRDGGIR